ncbi:MAG TPA: FHA domain-containing protein [Pyrinomonadaceae bacterium]
MPRVTLNIKSPAGERVVALEGAALTVGRTDASDVAVADDGGLSRRHVTFKLRGGEVWAFDEGSTNGTFVFGKPLPPDGLALKDGDEIQVGNTTSVMVNIDNEPAVNNDAAPQHTVATPNAGTTSSTLSPLALVAAVVVAALALGLTGLLIYRASSNASATSSEEAASELLAEDSNTRDDATNSSTTATANTSASESATHDSASPEPVRTGDGGAAATEATAPSSSTSVPQVSVLTPEPPAQARESVPQQAKLYREMSEEEKNEFVRRRAQHIAVMMGRRPYAFTPDALKHIRFWLDSFAKRAGNGRTGMWGGDTLATLERGRTHAPTIMRAFREYNVPVVVGLYIPFIETEYTNVSTNNSAGAAGLFQFLGSTAEGYGVPASERTDIPKMSVAAARYFRDNIMSFGSDPMSVALSIAGYNRAAESVKRDLRNVLNMPNNEDKERSFWTLIANQGVLDEAFQRENVNYVPRFFAAAIFGETPWAFGAKTRPLSTYTTPEATAAAATRPTPAPRH